MALILQKKNVRHVRITTKYLHYNYANSGLVCITIGSNLFDFASFNLRAFIVCKVTTVSYFQ